MLCGKVIRRFGLVSLWQYCPIDTKKKERKEIKDLELITQEFPFLDCLDWTIMQQSCQTFLALFAMRMNSIHLDLGVGKAYLPFWLKVEIFFIIIWATTYTIYIATV